MPLIEASRARRPLALVITGLGPAIPAKGPVTLKRRNGPAMTKALR